MSDYVVNFVKHGDPNGKGLARWSAAKPSSSATMEISDIFGSIALADDTKVGFYKRFYAAQKAW